MSSNEKSGAAGGGAATSQLANRIWAGIGARPKDQGGAVVDKAKVTWRAGSGPNVSAATGYPPSSNRLLFSVQREMGEAVPRFSPLHVRSAVWGAG